MALPFFRALNPNSKNSGIEYCLAGNNECQGTEMIDYKFIENIGRKLEYPRGFLSSVEAFYDVIVGRHFDIDLQGRKDSIGGAKGLLDFTILSLIARKLLADVSLPERKSHVFTRGLAYFVALPLEAARFTTAGILTLLALPIIALASIIKACMSKKNGEKTKLSGSPVSDVYTP